MKAGFLPIIFCLFALSVFAQTSEAIKIDHFGKIVCGDFMARMDGIIYSLRQSPDSKIHVIFYGERYRRESVLNDKRTGYDKVILHYPHREDGLNWAKAIPFYMSSGNQLSAEIRDFMKDKIVLVDGGYREEMEAEIWLVPKNAELPKPTPTIETKNVKFRKDKPRRVPDYTCCYCGY